MLACYDYPCMLAYFIVQENCCVRLQVILCARGLLVMCARKHVCVQEGMQKEVWVPCSLLFLAVLVVFLNEAPFPYEVGDGVPLLGLIYPTQRERGHGGNMLRKRAMSCLCVVGSSRVRAQRKKVVYGKEQQSGAVCGHAAYDGRHQQGRHKLFVCSKISVPVLKISVQRKLQAFVCSILSGSIIN